MIEEIFSDIKSFLIIFFLVIFGFANSFYLLAKNQEILTPIDVEVTYNTVLKAIRYTYLLALGDFTTDDFSYGLDEHFLWILFFLVSIALPIVLLNMLIAIMGTTFSRVETTSEANMLRERLSLIIENSFLPGVPNA